MIQNKIVLYNTYPKTQTQNKIAQNITTQGHTTQSIIKISQNKKTST